MSTSFATRRVQQRTTEQQQVVQQLAERWHIDPEKVLFLRKDKPLEPWLNYEALTAIARQSGRFRSLSEHFSTFISGLNHLVHTATVIDADGLEYTRSGAAELGETLVEGDEADEHNLAATRALRLALDSAGFDPIKAATVIPLDLKLQAGAPHKLPLDQDNTVRETQARIKDLKAIHALAAQKGLIVPSDDDPSRNDMTAYRAWLAENFNGTGTAANFSAAERAIAVNLLRQLPDATADLRTAN